MWWPRRAGCGCSVWSVAGLGGAVASLKREPSDGFFDPASAGSGPFGRVNPPEILLLGRVAQRFICSLSVGDRLEGGSQVMGNDEGVDVVVELRPRAVSLG